jgi:hypothetical protein
VVVQRPELIDVPLTATVDVKMADLHDGSLGPNSRKVTFPPGWLPPNRLTLAKTVSPTDVAPDAVTLNWVDEAAAAGPASSTDQEATAAAAAAAMGAQRVRRRDDPGRGV